MIAMIIMTMGEIIFFSISQSLCYEKSPDNKKGTNLGMYRMIFAMSRIAGPFLGSFIYESCGSSQLWYFCFILGIISITPALFLFKFV
jgi:MFS family permease